MMDFPLLVMFYTWHDVEMLSSMALILIPNYSLLYLHSYTKLQLIVFAFLYQTADYCICIPIPNCRLLYLHSYTKLQLIVFAF